MLRLAVVCLVAAMASQSTAVMPLNKRLVEKMHIYNLLSTCWGRENIDKFAEFTVSVTEQCGAATPTSPLTKKAMPAMPAQALMFRAAAMPVHFGYHHTYPYATSYSYGRKKRQAETENWYPGDVELDNYNAHMETMVGNLTCALRAAELLDENDNINMAPFDNADEYRDTPAGSDPVLVSKYQRGMYKCRDMANAIPASMFDANEFEAKYGPKMVFFKCMKMTELKICHQFGLVEMLEKFGGPIDPAPYGAKDKYDAALQMVEIWDANTTPEAQHIDNFFWGTAETMFD